MLAHTHKRNPDVRKIEADEFVFTWSTGMDIHLMLAAIEGSETKEGGVWHY
jgi:hypothetical protein